MQSYSTRAAEESDIDCLVNMRGLLQKHVEDSNSNIWRLSTKGYKQLKQQSIKWIHNKDTRVLLVVDNRGQAVGFAMGKICRHQEYLPQVSGIIGQVFIKKEYRRQGIGRKLIVELCKFFALNKVEDISVRYVSGNQEGERFWKKLGFKVRIKTAGTKRKNLLEKCLGL